MFGLVEAVAWRPVHAGLHCLRSILFNGFIARPGAAALIEVNRIIPAHDARRRRSPGAWCRLLAAIGMPQVRQ